MSDDTEKMSCAEFQAQLPELIGSGADAKADPHIQSCELCQRAAGRSGDDCGGRSAAFSD